MRFPRCHPVTVVLLSVVAFLLLWANLQSSTLWNDFGALARQVGENPGRQRNWMFSA
jgi:hypothetical protein